MSIQEARRAAFELACQRDYPGCYLGRFKSGKYMNHTIDSGWWAWNAALDSVCVVLPLAQEFCGSDGVYFEYLEPEYVEKAIEAAGVKCK